MLSPSHRSNAVGEAPLGCPLLMMLINAELVSMRLSGLVSELSEQMTAGAVEGAVSRLSLCASSKRKTEPPEEAAAGDKLPPLPSDSSSD